MFSNLWFSWIASVNWTGTQHMTWNHRSSSRRARSWRISLRSLKNPRKFQNPLKEVQIDQLPSVTRRHVLRSTSTILKIEKNRIRTYLNESHKDVDVLSLLSLYPKEHRKGRWKRVSYIKQYDRCEKQTNIRKCGTSTSLCMRDCHAKHHREGVSKRKILPNNPFLSVLK